MTRRFTTIVFTALLLPTIIPVSLAAQGRGSHRGAAVGAIRPPVSSPRSQPVFRTPPVVTPGLGTPRVTPVAPIARAPRVFVHPQRRVFAQQPFFGFASPFYSPFYSPYYSPYLFDTPYYTSPDYLTPTYSAPDVSQNEADLSYQVQQLSQEIEQLREQRALAASQPPAAPAAPEPPPTPTTLIFRDGHRMSILNYAIVGQTLWVLDENRSDKIPLSDLNLDATQKENRSRGVRFLIP